MGGFAVRAWRRVLDKAMSTVAGLLLGMVATGGATGVAMADTFTYRATLYGVTLGEASIDVDEHTGSYALAARLRTAGVGALFDDTDLNASAEGARAADSVTWRRYDLAHSYNRKFRRIAMRSGAVAVINPAFSNMGTPPATAAQKREAMDPLSAFYRLGQMVGAGGCVGRIAVFDGRHRYDLVLGALGTAEVRTAAWRGPVTRCSLRYVPIAGYNPRAANETRRIPEGEIQFARVPAGQWAFPVRVRVPTPLGMASLTLTRRAPD
jgi:hypothetical protein